MIFVVSSVLSISINLLLVLFVVVCILMVLLILMQRPKQDGLGAAFGGGVTDQVFGARTTNVLQKGTVYLGSLFFLLSVVLAILIGNQNEKITGVKKEEEAKPAENAVNEQPAAPAPMKSLVDELSKDDTEGDKPVEGEKPAENTMPEEGEAPPAKEGVPGEGVSAEGEKESDKTE